MLHAAKLSYTFWAEAVYMATYIRNRCISRALDKDTEDNGNQGNSMPEELWSDMKPDVVHLCIFECEAYILNNHYCHKFEPKAGKHIFVGYEANSKAYRLWNVQKRKIIIS